ncbi:unnamed protein product [Adineta steineri]|uniref:Uncharacterized protein n=1 Tax=Adineta steineri TaxID=433720 RepID=A0A815IBA4_9BILA|nr:unnamed protein product [Adineta steineri]CAF1600832.1 unnamed protein product [Adineta steineri]
MTAIRTCLLGILIIGTVCGVRVKVKNKCGFSLLVRIGNGDSGRWIDAGQESWGTNGRSDRTWAVQPGIWGDDTLAEINDDNGHIWYDISLVDGFTYPMALVPVGGAGGNRRNLYCVGWNVLNECPDNLKVWVNGSVRACKNHSVNPGHFKARCPDAYSWWGDDPSSMADTFHPDHMEVTFCP